MSLHVTDNFRTNPLSLKPGGYEVTGIHEGGKSFIYDKVKKPGSYIKSISNDNGHGRIMEILLDGKTVWQLGVHDYEPWDNLG
jgi:hypothetical protein